ncbi:hypothetical protein LENED_012095 [Lentinula edodes]|uniref:Uncharacterized protein n=1 Tax=Lentinula edodes TaxID=5353 RepID=A0A1Q3ERS1_LENED|nr:hypothetical protein LENED_012095 [Lentinula edodes]
MFANVLVLFAGLPVILGLTLDTPTNVTSGLVSNVTWTATDGDPTFTLELNHPSFSSSLALANNVNPTSGSPLSIEWPIVPADLIFYRTSSYNRCLCHRQYYIYDRFVIQRSKCIHLRWNDRKHRTIRVSYGGQEIPSILSVEYYMVVLCPE